ncbi:hypothetical protein [Enterococcus mundtii]|uniref:hypothetical protein n=1 Tax=Enterococcus mundtii TaxID=53346 RepID=UPI001A974026|nr:hypothetical protein [Enterococcus mundtii]MBO1087188.1 hypothetical protein [Enterococcus mundtii]
MLKINYPEIFIFGREVNGSYVEYFGNGECHSQVEAYRIVDHLQTSETNVGEWKVLKYGRPQTISTVGVNYDG